MPDSFLAPIHNYTDLPFRLLCRKYGAGAVCVPLAGAMAIARRGLGAAGVDAHRDEGNVGVQLVGGDTEAFGKAARRIADELPFVKWLNLNCGCPSSRTTETGGGSAMLRRPGKIAEAVGAMSKAGLPVSVKIRILRDPAKTREVCRAAEEGGAGFLVVHGRVPEAGYSGKADWEAIRTVREASGIPVVGNGDLKTSGDGRRMVEAGYCDSFMIGRAAMGNPMAFCGRAPASAAERVALLGEYLLLHHEYSGEPRLAAVKLKAAQMVTGTRGASLMRNAICRAESTGGIMSALRQYAENQKKYENESVFQNQGL